jgi:NurA-like 5'-3' nuclease
MKNSRLKPEFVLQVGDLREYGVNFPANLEFPEVEDLIPVLIATQAAQKYASEVCEVRERDLQDITEDKIRSLFESGITLFESADQCVASCSKDTPHLEKIGFARSVIEVVNALGRSANKSKDESVALAHFEENFKILFRQLDKMKSLAELERTRDKASSKVKEVEERFFASHPKTANREDVVKFLEQLEALLRADESFDGVAVKKGIAEIYESHKLASRYEEPIDNFEALKRDIRSLKYRGELESQEEQFLPHEQIQQDLLLQEINNLTPEQSILPGNLATQENKKSAPNKKR